MPDSNQSETKQYLLGKGEGGSVYDHLTGIISKLVTETPADSQQLFEHLSAAIQDEERKPKGPKRVLMVLTSNDKLGDSGEQTGWFLDECAHPYFVFIKAGFQVTFASPKGGVAPLSEDSLNLEDDENNQFWGNPKLKGLTEKTQKLCNMKSENFDAVFFVGGFGTMWDFPDNEDVQRLAREIYERGGVTSAVCHGPIALANVKLSNGEYLVKGKQVTAFTDEEEDAVKRREIVPYTCHTKLAEAGAVMQSSGAWQVNVAVAGNLITGQNPASAKPVAEAVVNALAPSTTPEDAKVYGDLLLKALYDAPGASYDKNNNKIPTDEEAEDPPEPTEGLQDLIEDASYLEWAGVGLGRDETQRLYLAMKKFAAEEGVPLVLWGKVMGTGSDYYVLEGEKPDEEAAESEEEPNPALVEGKDGVNKYNYYVCTQLGTKWTRLPNVNCAQIKASRQLKKYFKGDLQVLNTFHAERTEAVSVLTVFACLVGTSDGVSPLRGQRRPPAAREDC
jgi:putative intracellular protease/amidase